MTHYQLKDKVLYKHEQDRDKLRMGGGSWSINMDELNTTNSKIDKIVYTTEQKQYTISYQNAKTNGFYRILGGEQKLVVPIKFWEVTDIKK